MEARSIGQGLTATLDVTVPVLTHCRYRILTYRQPVEMYPGRMAVADSDRHDIADEKCFVAEVKSMLSSDRVKTMLASLRACAVNA